ncbi:hypothetical protein CE91St30_19140 [Raoultibacter timonensis]|uniref:Uncharacterized protein n=1 Tax=Raoultibacter timonensis TaxID=1907662 RepID=A0ABM7WJQ9_9ACTN|nr:hypothetical protein CE91St30_19140 [Raoultibacter timonensis]BDF51184.1 hypothetical protein CE91St31_19140 [Raoultibacter timonensis]
MRIEARNAKGGCAPLAAIRPSTRIAAGGAAASSIVICYFDDARETPCGIGCILDADEAARAAVQGEQWTSAHRH